MEDYEEPELFLLDNYPCVNLHLNSMKQKRREQFEKLKQGLQIWNRVPRGSAKEICGDLQLVKVTRNEDLFAAEVIEVNTDKILIMR